MAQQSLGRWISILYRYGHMYVSKAMEPYNIGKGQFMFLLALYHEDRLLQDELAKRLNIDKGTAARAIDKLEQSGYVIRNKNENDRRSNRICLTDKAIQFKSQFFSILDEWTNILSEGLTKEEVEMSFNLLEKMADNAARYVRKGDKK